MRPIPRLTAAVAVAALTLPLMTALSACAPTAASGPGASATAPLPVAGYDWFLNEDAEEPRLSYGPAQSDDVPLSLMCAPGSGKIGLALAAEPTGKPAITLESGGDAETYPARVEVADMHDGAYLIASARASDPVIQRFGRLGWLAVAAGDERWMMAAQPGSETRAARFLDMCLNDR